MSLSMAIKKRYPGFTLDVELEAGEERVALLGASGCGKSLTLRCIAGVETPDEGHIVVNGVTFFDSRSGVNLSPQERKTALLFQNYQLFPHMTALQNVCAGMPRPARDDRAMRFLEIFGVSTLADRHPSQLSGGQQQRVALARMLAARPGILMFDEPFSALDSYLKSALEQNLLDVFSVVNRTVLYVSHDIDEACRLCDRICVMHDGHVEEGGTAEELMARPRTLAGMRLTGCKNTSRARRVSATEVEAIDWGMTFDVGREVPGDVAYVGVRARHIHRECKNTSRARRVSATEVEAIDWGMTFDVGREVPGDVAYVGVRARHIHRDRERGGGERGRNSFDLHVVRVSDARFERLVLLEPPCEGSRARIQWKVDKLDTPQDEWPRAGETLRLHFDASRLLLVNR